MEHHYLNNGTYYSLEVLTEIFKNEDVSLTLQSHPEEVSRRVMEEIEALLDNFVVNSKRYANAKIFDEGDRNKLFKYKLLMDYYAITYIQASKNFHIYRASRWNLVEELATMYNGYYDFIPSNIINNLSDLEATHLRDRCYEIRTSLTVINTGKFSLIAILEDIVTDDISKPYCDTAIFYQKGMKLIVPSHMIELLKPANWIRIIQIDL